MSLPVVLELYWVLRIAYRLDADACATVLRDLLDTQELVVQADDAIRSALQSMNSAGLPDALIADLGRRAGCEHTVTFDRAAGRLTDMRLLTARRTDR